MVVNKPPLVSVCIPTYNGAEYLAEAIESVFAQSYASENLEIIVSDDNSQDKTIEIARAYQKRSPIKFKIFEHEQYGIAGNWNFSIAQSQGKYIKFIFQDDLMLPDCIVEMVNLAEKDQDLGLIFSPREVFLAQGAENDSGCLQVHQHGQDVHSFWSNLKQVQWGTDLLSDPQFFESPLNKVGEPSAVLIRKSVFERIGFFDEELHQTLDMDMWFRIMCNYKIGFCNQRLVRFRVHPDQASRKNLGLKNALDNQMLRAKMLYSSEFEIDNSQVKDVFRSGTQKLIQSELQQLLNHIASLQQQLKDITHHQEQEISALQQQIKTIEKCLEIELNLGKNTTQDLQQKNEFEYNMLIKHAWLSYADGDLPKMLSLFEKSRSKNPELLPTEFVSDLFNILTTLSQDYHQEMLVDTYQLLNNPFWSTFIKANLFSTSTTLE
jgi:glycosyltransferase involved in cell wall biosynthesis